MDPAMGESAATNFHEYLVATGQWQFIKDVYHLRLIYFGLYRFFHGLMKPFIDFPAMFGHLIKRNDLKYNPKTGMLIYKPGLLKVGASKNKFAHLDEKLKNDETGNETEIPADLRCALCEIRVNCKSDFAMHLAGAKHKRNAYIKELCDNLEKRVTEVNGISVTFPNSIVNPKNGTVFVGTVFVSDSDDDDQPLKFHGEIEVKNGSTTDILQLIGVKTPKQYQLELEAELPLTIEPGANLMIGYKLVLNKIGCYQFPVLFSFTVAGENTNSIKIVRNAQFNVVNAIIVRNQPQTPYENLDRGITNYHSFGNVVEGSPISGKNSRNFLETINNFGQYKIPAYLQILMAHGFRKFDGMNEKLRSQLRMIKNVEKKPLSVDNYQEKFELMLFVEELQMVNDIRKYDLHNVQIEPLKEDQFQHLVELKVSDIGESRPSVLMGDRVYLRSFDDIKGTEFTGVVQKVLNSSLWLKMGKKFLKRSNVFSSQYEIRFDFNKFPLLIKHRAIQTVAESEILEFLLFPTAIRKKAKKLNGKKIENFYDSKIKNNPQQIQAIEEIVFGRGRPAPYLVFGPPGTGKTMTIVESMKQILFLSNGSRILACAPSNLAADLLIERLAEHVKPGRLFRMNATSRDPKSISPIVKAYCMFDSEGFVTLPKRKKLLTYNVIVSTLITAGRLYSAGFPRDFFSHIFIDEAGQASEPETLSAVAGIHDHHQGLLVLAGDPEQLLVGPVLFSPFARKHLEVSLLERLMELPLYSRDDSGKYNSHVLTKLLRNYRSHSAILKIPNALFYENELIPCADPTISNLFSDWDFLPRKDFPLIFEHVVGEELREANSPSFFNPVEISVTCDYVKKVLSSKKVPAKDIGVITPYAKQVAKLRAEMRRISNEITVGSAEQFQGQERKVIILSTVRSNVEFLAYDAKFRLGFLRNQKRFNTAITRAQALLVIIGNGKVLCRDENWRQLLKFIYENGGVRGSFVFPADDDVEILDEEFAGLKIQETFQCPTVDESSAVNVAEGIGALSEL